MLEEQGVQFQLGTRVKEVQDGHVTLSDGTRIPTYTVIWAGGLKPASLSNNLETKTGPGVTMIAHEVRRYTAGGQAWKVMACGHREYRVTARRFSGTRGVS
jgi:NADH dehydrogenase FAD-containing subunit